MPESSPAVASSSVGPPLSLSLWQAVYVQARTPAPAVAQLHSALRQAMQAPGSVDLGQAQAGRPEPGSPEELTAFGLSERAVWGGVVRERALHLE